MTTLASLLIGLGLATAGSAADVWSTVRAIRVGLSEANPLITDSNGKFILWRAIALKGVCFVSPIVAVLLHMHPWVVIGCGAGGGLVGAVCAVLNIRTYNAWVARKL